jgi:hypothetical protein
MCRRIFIAGARATVSERTKLRRVRLVAERSFPSFEADPTFRLYPGKR